jgi:hypothetical protein
MPKRHNIASEATAKGGWIPVPDRAGDVAVVAPTHARMVVMAAMGWRAGRVVDVADVPVQFRATDRVRAESVERFLGGFLDAGREPEAVVRVGAVFPAVPRRRADQTIDGFDVWTSGAALQVRLGASGRVAADESSAVIGIREGAAGDVFGPAFHFVVTHLLGLRDRFVVHGAAIAYEGRAFVILGPTGTGKSTLVGATLGSDWLPLADDLVVLRTDGESVMVAGIRRAAAVPGDVGVPAGVQSVAGDPRRRWVVPPDVLRPGWFPVAGLITVGHGDSPIGALNSIGGHEALRALVRSFTSVANPLLMRGFLVPSSAVARLPGWRLEHGADAHTRLDRARALLDGVLADAATPS